MHFNSQTDSTALDYTYQELEDEFVGLMNLNNLDRVIAGNPDRVESFELELEVSLSAAFESGAGCPQARLLLQRILYRINRLKLF